MEALPAAGASMPVPTSDSFYFNVELFEHAQRVAQMFSKSTMIPDHYQNNVGNCIIAFNLAARLNMDPFAVMQSVSVIHGRPGMEGKLVSAIINGSNKFSPLQYKFEGEGDEYGCYAYAKRLSTGDELRGPKVTWKMVKSEGWNIDKQKRNGPGVIKSKWNTMPEPMFMYRAASFFGRVHYSEGLMGMQTREELEDVIPMRQVTPVAVTEEPGQKITYEIQTPEQPAPSAKQPEPPAESAKARDEDPRMRTGQAQPEPERLAPSPENWWDDDKNWKFRRGQVNIEAILIDHRDEFAAAAPENQAGFKQKFFGKNGSDQAAWDRIMGTTPEPQQAPAQTEAPSQIDITPQEEPPLFFSGSEDDFDRMHKICMKIDGYPKELIEQAQFELKMPVGDKEPRSIPEAQNLLALVHTKAARIMPSIDKLNELKVRSPKIAESVIKRHGKPRTEEDCKRLITLIGALAGPANDEQF